MSESYIKGELTLLSISDCGDKDTPPGYPIHYLVAAAINGAPEKKLSMMEIRLALLRRFPYFANNLGEGVNWMASTSLSINPFCRQLIYQV